jgi:broad specificity phosphatase PhoE
MKVYFVRHGQSEGNISGRHNAWSQVPLTEQGRLDAAMAGRMLKGIPFDKVYTSDLIRAIETKEIAMPGVEYEVLPMLREVCVGHLLGRKIEDCAAEYGEIYFTNRWNTDFSPYGGESREELHQRIREFLSMLEKTDYENVAVFGHGTYCHCIFSAITGLFYDSTQLPCHNGSVSVFEFKNGIWRLEAWNCREFA